MEGSKLVVHSGGWDADMAALQAAPVPEATATFTPVPHARFVEEVRFNLSRFNLTCGRERFALARQGAQMFGVLDVANGSKHEDWTLAIGLRNSYDHSFALGLVAGAGVFVCDNLSFSGEVQATRKHTANVFRDLPSLIYGMLDRCVAHRRVLEAEIDGMKAVEVDDRGAHHVMCEAVKRNVMPASTLPFVLKEWGEPSFPEFTVRSAWALFNAFTWAQKQRSPKSQMDDTLRLTKLFREEFSIN